MKSVNGALSLVASRVAQCVDLRRGVGVGVRAQHLAEQSCPGGQDTTVYVYTAEPDSPSERALDLLASWALSGDTARPPAV